MRNAKHIKLLSLLLPLIIGLLLSPSLDMMSVEHPSSDLNDIPDDDASSTVKGEPIDSFHSTQDSKSGNLRPNEMIQRGHQQTDTIRARTDSGQNTIQNITIDGENGWAVEKSKISVSQLRKLYAKNGTFDDGHDPWTNYTYDPTTGDQTQVALWNSTNEYVTAINYGEVKTHPVTGDSYTHHYSSEILWQQIITNSPQSDNFSLSFAFRYVTGPLDPQPYDLAGDVELRIYVHNDIYYMSLCEIEARNVWFTIDDFPIDLVGAPASFSLEIGFFVEYDDLVLEEDGDYDSDGQPDGLINAQKIELHLDDVEFTSISDIPFEDVELTFHVETDSSPIIGPTGGLGTATISNPLYWSTDPLEVRVSGNSSVAIQYQVTTYFTRIMNSSWTTDLSAHGVSYSVNSGESIDLEAFTYVTSSSDYENLTLEIHYPWDWENATVWDPLNSNITGLCETSLGTIFVPDTLFDRVGWWRLEYQARNYADNISLQIHEGLGTWSEESVFRTGNTTRTQAVIGTSLVTPIPGSEVNMSWILPNQTVWAFESITSMVDGNVVSKSLHFGSNASAGLWSLEVYWNNGTELAFSIMPFSVYHRANASVEFPTIETTHGLVISNLITLVDGDTGEFLLDDSVSITANWSSSTVAFTQNYAKNWWSGTFDTNLISGGRYRVIISITRPYFDSIQTEFEVICVYETETTITNAGSIPIENGLNEIFTVELNYDYLNGSGIEDASHVVSFTGPAGGLSWHSFADNGNGAYSLDIQCNTSGTYEISIGLSKPYYYNTSDTFTMIIGATGATLDLINGTADAVLFGDSYRLVVDYRNSTGSGLPDADVVVVATTPETGIVTGNFTPISEGLYELTITPSSAGTYSIVISASIVNHETVYATFTLTASGIPTVLTSLPSSATIAVDQNFTLQLMLQDESFNPIDGANISVIDAPPGLTISEFTPLGGGYYNVTLSPLGIDTFDLLFRATAENYQSSSSAFALSVTEIQTSLAFAGDVSSDSSDYLEPYSLMVYYMREDTDDFVTGANLVVETSNPEAVTVTITENPDHYLLTLKGNTIGTWSLTIIANLSDHRVATKLFLFEVTEIETQVDGAGPLDAILFGRTYTYNFTFTFESNSSDILGASVLAFGAGSEWVSYEQDPTGVYMVQIIPSDVGDFSVLLSFEEYGYNTATFRLNFRVVRIPVTVIVNQGLSGLEGTSHNLIVTVLESDTGDPVSGAIVSCRILQGEVTLQIHEMTETPTAGIYSVQIQMPSADGSYSIRIEIEASHHILNSAYQQALSSERTLLTFVQRTITEYFYLFIGLGAVVVGYGYRRRLRKKRIRENLAAHQIKKRFDAVKNLLGVIVLHKESGLPIYSKILREGLDETVISAFITAITNFRGEFDIERSEEEEWALVPISDIVRVIATGSLYCAFITVGRPSEDQRERMIRFAQTVSFIFDEQLKDVPIAILDQHNKRQFESLFNDILDGALLKTYTLSEEKKYKPSSCADERIARRRGVEFLLDELAADIASCGLEEGRVYKAIMEAIEHDLLVLIEKDEMVQMDTGLTHLPDLESDGL